MYLIGERTALDALGRYAATLTATEIGLGSLLHSLHVPFSGNFLSLNQGFLLSQAVWRHRDSPGIRIFPARISAVAAILKSLSPAGKRLTPMLAIAAQGLWYSLGTFVFGANALGMLVGMMLLCLWPFVQPFLISYVLFGKTWFEAVGFSIRLVQKYLPVSDQGLIVAFFSVVALKLVLGLVLVWLSRHAAGTLTESLLKRGADPFRRKLRLSQPATPRLAAREALRDLSNPLFIISFVLVALFFIFCESSRAPTIWQLLRPVAFGFVIYFSVRLIPDRYLPKDARHTLRILREES